MAMMLDMTNHQFIYDQISQSKLNFISHANFLKKLE